MYVADDIARRSLCTRDCVGAVIVSPTNRIIATGYNGPPATFPHDDKRCSNWCERARKDNGFRAPEVVAEILSADYSDCTSLHAEANALMVCDRKDREGGTIYVTSDICFNCAKLIANSGLRRVVVCDTYRSYRNVEASYDFLRTCEIEVSRVPR